MGVQRETPVSQSHRLVTEDCCGYKLESSHVQITNGVVPLSKLSIPNHKGVFQTPAASISIDVS